MLAYAIVLNLAYAMSALSWAVRDIVLLRALAIGSSAAFLVANLINPHGFTGMTFAWQLLFVALNGGRIALEIRERRRAHFDVEDEELYQTVFVGFNRVEFAKLRRQAVVRTFAPGERLTEQGAPVPELLLLANGVAEVERKGQRIAELKDGAWVGEMGFISERPASATVVAREPTRCLAWDIAALRGLLARNPAMGVALQGLFGRQLADRLVTADSIAGQMLSPFAGRSLDDIRKEVTDRHEKDRQ